jgi:hypothetical protein
MKWLEKQVSLYKSHSDNRGRSASFREVLESAPEVEHYYYDMKTKSIEGPVVDRELIEELRSIPQSHSLYKAFKAEVKAALQCYTPAALLASKKKGSVIEIERTGVMQLDFDYEDIKDYDVEELKQCVFSLPFIGFCSRSCSGDGFYALALIAEPEKLSDYAEHCFAVLLKYGIKADTSKGKGVENLRYLSYDNNMLIREDPEILHVKHFQPKTTPKKTQAYTSIQKNFDNTNKLIDTRLKMVQDATVGNRFQTVQKVAFTLGGLNDKSILGLIEQVIKNSSQFAGEEDKYCKCAEDCFNAGKEKPLIKI